MEARGTLAADPVAVETDVAEMIINRIIDNAGVAVAAINRGPVATARAPRLYCTHGMGGATVFGLPPATKVHAEWAAWANGTAVRELDFHDTFLAADYSHPGDNIPPLLAVAQQLNRSGADLIRGLGDGLRGADRPGKGHLSSCPQDRPYCASRAIRGSRPGAPCSIWRRRWFTRPFNRRCTSTGFDPAIPPRGEISS